MISYIVTVILLPYDFLKRMVLVICMECNILVLVSYRSYKTESHLLGEAHEGRK